MSTPDSTLTGAGYLVKPLTPPAWQALTAQDVARNLNTVRNGATGPEALRQSFAKVKAGEVVFWIGNGDSTTSAAGAGTNGGGTSGLVGARRKSWMSRLAKELTAKGIPTNNEAILGSQGVQQDGTVSYTDYDPRLVVSGGFAVAATPFTFGLNFWTATTAGAVWEFSPESAFEKARIPWARSTNNGSLTVAIDGNVVGTINQAGVAGYFVSEFTAPSRKVQKITLTAVSASTVFVGGAIPYDSTVGGLYLLQGGQWGKGMGQLAANGSPWFPSHPTALPALGIDTVITQMTINDPRNGVSPATYAAQLATWDDAVAATGANHILMSGLPYREASGTDGRSAAIVAEVVRRASSANRIYLNQDARLISGDVSAAKGWMYDLLHGNARLYADEAEWVAGELVRISQA